MLSVIGMGVFGSGVFGLCDVNADSRIIHFRGTPPCRTLHVALWCRSKWQGEAISSVRTDKSNLHLVSFRKSTGGLPLSFDVRGHE
jgi:hypothetical protein